MGSQTAAAAMTDRQDVSRTIVAIFAIGVMVLLIVAAGIVGILVQQP